MATQKFYANQSANIRPSDSSYNDHTSEVFNVGVNANPLLSFNVGGAGSEFNIITNIALALYLTAASSAPNYTQVSALGDPFDEETVTYAKAPGVYNTKGYNLGSASIHEYFVFDDIAKDATAAKYIVSNGVMMSAVGRGQGCSFQSSRAANKPYIEITTSTAIATGSLKNFAPASGYIDLSKDNIFGFDFEQKADEPSIKLLAVKSFTLQLREHGQTEITSINVTTWAGDAPNVTVPAGTISGESIDWRVIAKTNANQTLTSDWMTLSVEDVPPTAWAISPKDVVVDGSKDQIFIWGHASSTGTAQSKTALQKSADGSTWQTLATVNGSARQWTCPAGTLTSSIKYWRVRTYNADGIAGEWSDAAQIVVIAAPMAPSIQIKSTGPRPSISWQTSGSYDFYLVYRNGKPIAKLTQTQYTDELSSGSTTYQVRGCYNDSSNYGLSSAVTVTITTGQYVTLYGIASGKKVTLKHCGLKNQPVQNAINRDIQYIFMYGSTYPHAERSEFVTKKVGGTAVFLPGEDKAGFDALIGELVCLKTQSGEMVIGYLNETSDVSRVNPDKSVVNFSIQQIDYAEVIDIDS